MKSLKYLVSIILPYTHRKRLVILLMVNRLCVWDSGLGSQPRVASCSAYMHQPSSLSRGFVFSTILQYIYSDGEDLFQIRCHLLWEMIVEHHARSCSLLKWLISTHWEWTHYIPASLMSFLFLLLQTHIWCCLNGLQLLAAFGRTIKSYRH